MKVVIVGQDPYHTAPDRDTVWHFRLAKVRKLRPHCRIFFVRPRKLLALKRPGMATWSTGLVDKVS